ncbi:helix-turn-helix domain-containing protein [Amycolatopsis sp. NPDC005232]|uniref:TetR/AcrR family transcriptional regulator n=1 Tax=Amycolatopsis sp. NPDC005232 TaxID=3157027 RepID=UPI0033AE5B0F
MPLRQDAERNRVRILEAARRVFARDGLDASMNSVAREAGVGPATLFRRFPTKEALIDEVFSDRMDAHLAAIDDALAAPDPWQGLRTYIQIMCERQAEDAGFSDVITSAFVTAKGVERRRQHAYRRLNELIARAKNTGRLRQDFTAEDVILIQAANAGVITTTASDAPGAWRRVVELMLQALEQPTPPPLPPAPTPSAVYRAMLRAARRRDATRTVGDAEARR